MPLLSGMASPGTIDRTCRLHEESFPTVVWLSLPSASLDQFCSLCHFDGDFPCIRAFEPQYDLAGRIMKQSNPFEADGYWAAAGDDAAGWFSTTQTYDWKGRPLLTTNQDGTQRYASYNGCGCAGGEVATVTDEVGRRRLVHSDVLGRN